MRRDSVTILILAAGVGLSTLGRADYAEQAQRAADLAALAGKSTAASLSPAEQAVRQVQQAAFQRAARGNETASRGARASDPAKVGLSQLPKQIIPPAGSSSSSSGSSSSSDNFGSSGGDDSQIANFKDYTDQIAKAGQGIRDANRNLADETIAQIQSDANQKILALMKQTQTNLTGLQVSGITEGPKDGITIDRTPVGNRTIKDQLGGLGRNASSRDPLAVSLGTDAKPGNIATLLSPDKKSVTSGSASDSKDSAETKKQKEDDKVYKATLKGVDDEYQKSLNKVGSDAKYNSLVKGINESYDKTLAKQGLGKAVATDPPTTSTEETTSTTMSSSPGVAAAASTLMSTTTRVTSAP